LPTNIRSRSGFKSRLFLYTARAWKLSSCTMTNV
jgi:hypothetical protein